jgi:hypothetical protein
MGPVPPALVVPPAVVVPPALVVPPAMVAPAALVVPPAVVVPATAMVPPAVIVPAALVVPPAMVVPPALVAPPPVVAPPLVVVPPVAPLFLPDPLLQPNRQRGAAIRAKVRHRLLQLIIGKFPSMDAFWQMLPITTVLSFCPDCKPVVCCNGIRGDRKSPLRLCAYHPHHVSCWGRPAVAPAGR